MKIGIRADLSTAKKIPIPEQWQSNSIRDSLTRSKLIESRKKDSQPDISYDLDGDGSVGHKDLFLAKQFDLDRDGKLNESERKNAEIALA